MTIFRFVERLNGVRAELNILDGDIKAETARFSEDIKYFAEFTTGHHHHPLWSITTSDGCKTRKYFRYKGFRALDEES